jgi:hypothetical protein
MAENDKSKQSSTPKVRDSKSQLNVNHKVDDGISKTKAYQPIVDRTTTPPPAKGDGNKK